MIKQVLITGIAAVGLLLSAQASAHSNKGSIVVWKNNAHSHGHKHHVKKVRRPAPYNVNAEQHNQAQMIKNGIGNCQITPSEAKKLNKRQTKIKKAEHRMRNSGHGLSYTESMKLKKRLHAARVQINRLSKNGKKSRHCGRSKKRSHGKGHGHSHGHSQHTHTRGNKFHGHNSRSNNNQGTFSISFGH